MACCGCFPVCFKRIVFFFKYVFLLTLPFTFLPVLVGVIDGYFFSRFMAAQWEIAARALIFEAQSAREMDWFSVPGGPGIHDTPLGPFHILNLRDPSNWWEKIGMVKPGQNMAEHPPFGFENALTDLPCLQGLFRRASVSRPGEVEAQEWHHWVYISPGLFYVSGLPLHDMWDRAFDEMLQRLYVTPAAHGASFTYVSCGLTESFLCSTWGVRAPSLLHFTTAVMPDDDEDPSEQLRRAIHRQRSPFRPVTARVVELPLDPDDMLDPAVFDRILPPGTFPDPLTQLLALVRDPDAWMAFGEYTEVHQQLQRFGDHLGDVLLERYVWLKWLHDAEDAFLDFVGGEDTWGAVLHLMAISVAALATNVVFQTAESLGTFAGFLNPASTDADPDSNNDGPGNVVDYDEDGGLFGLGRRSGEPNMMAHMLRNFMDQLPEEQKEFLQDSPEARAAVDKMWDIAYNGPQSDGEGKSDETQHDQVL